MARIIAATFALTATLMGCAHPRPRLRSSVAVPAEHIVATDHDAITAKLADEPSDFARRLSAARHDASPHQCSHPQLAAARPHPPGPAQYLILSGGSLNGAFGAGLFLGLQESNLLPPEPDVVTGVSTGSLQATFLFLAHQDVPGDRDYRGIGGLATEPGGEQPAIATGRSNIEDLAAAYSIRKESDILKPVPLGGIGLLLNGTMGDLEPLRRRLFALISPRTIEEVAIEACRGRRLYVGVTNIDDGQAYALDLTALALRAYDGNATPQLMTLVRKAYVESLIASSSVPAGAKPVRLRILDIEQNQHRINLFVDGGARFGVFFQEIKRAREAEKAMTASPVGGDVTLVVNTRLTVSPWHESEDLADPPSGWLLTTLGLRTIDILENQVYRLSVSDVETKADDLGTLRMAYMSNEGVPKADTPDSHAYRGRLCSGWHRADKDAGHPIQFYPTYMACLIDYGRQRGRLGQWNRPRDRTEQP